MKTQKQMNPLEKRSRKIVEEVNKLKEIRKSNKTAIKSKYDEDIHESISFCMQNDNYKPTIEDIKRLENSNYFLEHQVDLFNTLCDEIEEKLQKQREDELKFLKKLTGKPIFFKDIKDRIKELEKEA